ncbi:MAG: hypothetical protein ACC700_10880 [Anaerolineales bacterium]
MQSAASTEVDANDPADPDGVQNLTNADSDDELVDFFITLTALPPPTTLSVDVVGPEGSPGGTFYINAMEVITTDSPGRRRGKSIGAAVGSGAGVTGLAVGAGLARTPCSPRLIPSCFSRSE